jgi:UDPglucose--hexose-1-phosphate uridylyltransferase
MPENKNQESSEFRQDIVSGDWVLIATGRKKRPHDLAVKEKREPTPKDKCPFENPQASGNAEPVIIRPADDKDNWSIQVIPNLYPAVSSDPAVIPSVSLDGPYFHIPGAGYHDIVITRNHDNNFSRLSAPQATEVLSVMQERYKAVAEDPRIAYVSIFHNWGVTAGASIYHPHYQIISIPVIPPDVSHSLRGSGQYHAENGLCVHCAILEKEIKEKKRIIFENENAIAFLPFVSREPFEIRIFPKKHDPYFEDCEERRLADVAEALRKSLEMLENSLGSVDYNFFIHTAPVKNKEDFSYYHWHIEVQPKISILGGFELGTGIEITVVDPDDAAAFLRGEQTD